MKITANIIFVLLCGVCSVQSISLKKFPTNSCRKAHGSLLRSSVIDDVIVKEEDAITSFLPRRTIPIVNTASMNISAANFFGRQVLSTAECKRELIGLLSKTIEIEEEFLDYRVEYLTKYLEYKYIPIQTIPFLNFALSGNWDMLYSNALVTRADKTLDYTISQEIIADEGEGSATGILNNIVKWELKSTDCSYLGDLVVNCKYLFNTKGDLDVSLQEHLLMPNGNAPQDVEELIMSIQRSIPFESFDPDDIRIKNTVGRNSECTDNIFLIVIFYDFFYLYLSTHRLSFFPLQYVDPDIRISRITGEKFENIVNVFVKKPINLPTKPALRRGAV